MLVGQSGQHGEVVGINPPYCVRLDSGRVARWDGEDLEPLCQAGSQALAEFKEKLEPIGRWRRDLDRILTEVNTMMSTRHKKYGPGNIAKHGPAGILVRMDDKFARLESGQGNFDDETIENTLDDIIGYAIIWKMWVRGEWPGSPVARKDISD